MIFDETKVLVLFSLDRLFLATKRSKKLVLKKDKKKEIVTFLLLLRVIT